MRRCARLNQCGRCDPNVLGAGASAPKVAAVASVLPRSGLSMPHVVAARVRGVEVRSASPPVLAAVATEPDPEMPKPMVAWVAAAPSKARVTWIAAPGISPALRLVALEPRVSVARATLDPAAPVGGGVFDPALGTDNYPGGPPAGADRDELGVGRPDRPPEPNGPGSRPNPSEPPTATPKPSPVATPEPASAATPKPPVATRKPPSTTHKPGRPEKGGVKEPRPGPTVDGPRTSGPSGQQRAGSGRGPPEHAQAGGRGGAPDSGGKGSHGHGGQGSSGKGGNGNGNGNGRK
jgi:hypothetical protein